MVDLMSQYQKIKPAIDSAILNVIENAQFINGPEVSGFQFPVSEGCDLPGRLPAPSG